MGLSRSGSVPGSSNFSSVSQQDKKSEQKSSARALNPTEKRIPEGGAPPEGKSRTVKSEPMTSAGKDEETQIENLKEEIPNYAKKLWVYSLRDDIERLKNNEEPLSITLIEIHGKTLYPQRDEGLSDDEYVNLLDEIDAALPDQKDDVSESNDGEDIDYMETIKNKVNLLHQLLLSRYKDKDEEESLKESLKILRPLVQRTFAWSSPSSETETETETESKINVLGRPPEEFRKKYESVLQQLKTRQQLQDQQLENETTDNDDNESFTTAVEELQPIAPPAPPPPPIPEQTPNAAPTAVKRERQTGSIPQYNYMDELKDTLRKRNDTGDD